MVNIVLNNPFVKVKYILILSVNNLVAGYCLLVAGYRLLVEKHPATSTFKLLINKLY